MKTVVERLNDAIMAHEVTQNGGSQMCQLLRDALAQIERQAQEIERARDAFGEYR